jgi:hypothetical protein
MFRAEEMVNLPGGITLETKGGAKQVVNSTGMVVRDAVLIDVFGKKRYTLGEIAVGASVPVGAPDKEPEKPKQSDMRDQATAKEKEKPEPEWLGTNRTSMAPKDPFLETLRGYDWHRPEDDGEWRLVGWVEKPHPGQKLEPTVDRHRGFRLIVAHLTYGTPPAPDSAPFFADDKNRDKPDAKPFDASQPNNGADANAPGGAAPQ